MPRINNEQFYATSIQKHGKSAQGVCWLSNAHQQIRFDAILSLLPSKLDSFIVADAGCGFGDFYLYLEANSLLPQEYLGIDSLEIMCNMATKNINQKIIQADIIKETIPSADYYVCSGALNLLTSFETHLFIRNCFLASKHAFIFNTLHGDKHSDTYNYISTCQIEKIANDLAVKEVVLEHGYLDNDITVGFFK